MSSCCRLRRTWSAVRGIANEELKAARASWTGQCVPSAASAYPGSRAAAWEEVAPTEARYALAASRLTDRSPSPACAKDRPACVHWVSSRWIPLKELKQLRTAKSKSTRAACWASGGLHRTLWVRRACPAQERRRRSATWLSSNSPMASNNLPAAAARAAVCAAMKEGSPIAAPRNSMLRRRRLSPAGVRRRLSGKWAVSWAASTLYDPTTSHFCRFNSKPSSAHRCCTWRSALATSGTSPARSPSSK